jgi:hypothetical protein
VSLDVAFAHFSAGLLYGFVLLLVAVDDPYRRSLSERVRLNRAILSNKYWYLPVDDKGHENFQPVGRGVKSSDWCGRSRGLMVCSNVDAHEGLQLDGVDSTGKVVVRLQHFWCKKSSCPVCFIRGWSVRGAGFITSRLNEAVKCGFGDVEHVVVSVAKSDYDLRYEVMRGKAVKVLNVCSVGGGALIFHGFREDRHRKVLAWSPHFHCLGFIADGYARCRHCKGGDCYSCSGFEGRCYRVYRENGYIVRALEERKTVFGTAWYQLHHATIRIGIKRFHVVTWFGVCGYRNFKSVKRLTEVSCPVCGDAMSRHAHVGKRHIVRDLGHVGYVPYFIDDELDDTGKPNYVDAVGGRVE